MAVFEADDSGAIRLDWVGLGGLFKNCMLKVLFLSFLFKSRVSFIFTIYDLRVGWLAMAVFEADDSGAIWLDWVGLSWTG